jgi:hypothetical protein
MYRPLPGLSLFVELMFLSLTPWATDLLPLCGSPEELCTKFSFTVFVRASDNKYADSSQQENI